MYSNLTYRHAMDYRPMIMDRNVLIRDIPKQTRMTFEDFLEALPHLKRTHKFTSVWLMNAVLAAPNQPRSKKKRIQKKWRKKCKEDFDLWYVRKGSE